MVQNMYMPIQKRTGRLTHTTALVRLNAEAHFVFIVNQVGWMAGNNLKAVAVIDQHLVTPHHKVLWPWELHRATR